MKKFAAVFVFVLWCIVFPLTAVHAEQIQSFSSQATIAKDGTVEVSETILYDFESAVRHGIYRSIPFIKRNVEGKRYRIGISDVSVTDETGKPYSMSISTEGEYKKIKIGDADKTVTGKHTYIIRYITSGALTYFSDHDELYWQATGTEWDIPIQRAFFSVVLPGAVDAASLNFVCYTGAADSTTQNCTKRQDNGTVYFETNRELYGGEGLTGVVGFPRQMIAVLEPQPVDTWWSQLISLLIMIGLTLATVFWYLVLPIWIVVHWFKTGRDPKPAMGVASAWFDVPKSKSLRPLTPGETGSLVDEIASMREITATIIDLARRGYLRIVEKKKNDFYLIKTSNTEKSDHLEQFEKTLYSGIFDGSDEMRMKDADISIEVGLAKKKLYEALVHEKFFDKNPEDTRTKYTILGMFAVFTLNFPLALSSFIFGRAMPRKTLLGAQTSAIALALRNFITSQKRQFEFQANKQLFFEKFLPYAVVFGVEKIWAQRFEDFGIKKPDWYEGYGNRTFNSVYFVNSLSSSMHSFTSAATPTKSSSGFSSGFSGGSVGGGGGGGGGGSW